MSAGALHSDHINYLILRYLQESGHENAAVAFYRDWHRPRGHRDPETLPFAPAVGRHELISVIQEGLRHDDMVARVAREKRRFRWTLDTTATESLENGTATSRPSSSGKRKPRAPHVRTTDDFPTPAPKRQRRSEGPDAIHINGDHEAMDLDGVSPSVDVDDDGENGSPAIGSEAEVAEPPPRYDSVAIQTDAKSGPKTSTMYWKIDNPGSLILHSAWNPDLDSKKSRTLLTVGESLCRLYDVPASMQETSQISHVDYPSLPANFVITASAWHPSGKAATCAVDSTTTGADGKQRYEQTLIDHSHEFGSGSYGNGPKPLPSAGIVLCLRYSLSGDYLLVARTNSGRGSIQVWPAPRPGSDEYNLPRDPIAWKSFEHQILDTCWAGDDSFLVSGEKGLSTLYRLNTEANTISDVTDETITMHGMDEQRQHVVALSENWDKVRFDESLNLAVFFSTESHKLLPASITPIENMESKYNEDVVELAGSLSAAAFQPRSRHVETETTKTTEPSSLLAVAFEEGYANIYRMSQPQSGVPKCQQIATLHLSEGCALALSWSPDGRHLAVCGANFMQIWNQDSFAHSKSDKTRHEPVITWRLDSGATDVFPQNGELNGDNKHDLMEPSLSWSANGESLAFAIDKQLAVIKFTPPLTVPQQNGMHQMHHAAVITA